MLKIESIESDIVLFLSGSMILAIEKFKVLDGMLLSCEALLFPGECTPFDVSVAIFSFSICNKT